MQNNRPNRKRPYGAQVMLTYEERKELHHNAARRNMTLSEYIRYMTIGRRDDLAKNEDKELEKNLNDPKV